MLIERLSTLKSGIDDMRELHGMGAGGRRSWNRPLPASRNARLAQLLI